MPYIDPDTRQQTTAYLTAEEKAFVASVAVGNTSPESDVIKQGLGLLIHFKNLGITNRIHLPPIGNEEERTLLVLDLDLSQGVTTIDEYQHLYEAQELGNEA